VQPGAKLAKADIKRAYRAGIVANHPDRGGNEEKAKAIIASFKFLEPFLT
jgi:curved DNA-binding protein CbpA